MMPGGEVHGTFSRDLLAFSVIVIIFLTGYVLLHRDLGVIADSDRADRSCLRTLMNPDYVRPISTIEQSKIRETTRKGRSCEYIVLTNRVMDKEPERREKKFRWHQQRDVRIMPRSADLSKVNQSNAILC
jgi:hypothetical protein